MVHLIKVQSKCRCIQSFVEHHLQADQRPITCVVKNSLINMQSCQCFWFYRKTPDFTTQFTIVRF